MKYKILIPILFLINHFTFGQADGIYRIMYKGTVTIEHGQVTKIKLPIPPYLHGYENDSSEFAFIEYELQGLSFEVQIGSHLTSELFNEANDYLKLYKGRREFIKVILFIQTIEGVNKVEKKIPWDDVVITKIKDEGFGNLFEIDLAEIVVKN